MNRPMDNPDKGTGLLANTYNDSLDKAALKLQMGELRKTYLTLEKSRDFYASLCDHCPAPYLVLTEDGFISVSNQAAANLLGVASNKLKNKRFSRYIGEGYKDIWNRQCQLAKQTESKQNCELTLSRPDGSTVFVQADCLFKEGLDDSPHWLISLSDISPYKKTDEMLRIADVAFQAQNGLVITNANKVILRVNDAFTRITGYSSEEAVSQNINMLSSGNHDDAYYQAMWVAIMSHGYWQGEIWDKRKNGQVYLAWLTITGVFDSNGCISHYVGCMTDITPHKQAEKILLETRHRLENQRPETEDEIHQREKEKAEIDAALAVLLKYQESGKNEVSQAISRELEETILPFLKKLRTASVGGNESSQLLNIVENNLTQLVNAYVRKDDMPNVFEQLTPPELQVACMIRQGIAPRDIATNLNITEETVNNHCNQIRKKFGVTRKTENLQTYLKSLHE